METTAKDACAVKATTRGGRRLRRDRRRYRTRIVHATHPRVLPSADWRADARLFLSGFLPELPVQGPRKPPTDPTPDVANRRQTGRKTYTKPVKRTQITLGDFMPLSAQYIGATDELRNSRQLTADAIEKKINRALFWVGMPRLDTESTAQLGQEMPTAENAVEEDEAEYADMRRRLRALRGPTEPINSAYGDSFPIEDFPLEFGNIPKTKLRRMHKSAANPVVSWVQPRRLNTREAPEAALESVWTEDECQDSAPIPWIDCGLGKVARSCVRKLQGLKQRVVHLLRTVNDGSANNCAFAALRETINADVSDQQLRVYFFSQLEREGQVIDPLYSERTTPIPLYLVYMMTQVFDTNIKIENRRSVVVNSNASQSLKCAVWHVTNSDASIKHVQFIRTAATDDEPETDIECIDSLVGADHNLAETWPMRVDNENMFRAIQKVLGPQLSVAQLRAIFAEYTENFCYNQYTPAEVELLRTPDTSISFAHAQSIAYAFGFDCVFVRNEDNSYIGHSVQDPAFDLDINRFVVYEPIVFRVSVSASTVHFHQEWTIIDRYIIGSESSCSHSDIEECYLDKVIGGTQVKQSDEINDTTWFLGGKVEPSRSWINRSGPDNYFAWKTLSYHTHCVNLKWHEV